jgi:hypothetical protein
MDLSQKEIERLEGIVQRLKSCETHEAISLLWQLREDTAGEETQSSDDSQHGTVLRDTGSLVPSIDRHSLVERQTLLSTGSDTMPTKHTTSLAVQAYFAQGDPIFLVMNKKRCDDLIRRVYHGSTTPSTTDICEVFAIAAAGCHFKRT